MSEGTESLEPWSHLSNEHEGRIGWSMALDAMRFEYRGSSKRALPNLSPKWGRWENFEMERDPKPTGDKTFMTTGGLVAYKENQVFSKRKREKQEPWAPQRLRRATKASAQKGRWRSGWMIRWRRELVEGQLRATRPRSVRLWSRSPSHKGEGGSRCPIVKGKGRSEMEEGRGTTWESLERGVRERGCEVWKMEGGRC